LHCNVSTHGMNEMINQVLLEGPLPETKGFLNIRLEQRIEINVSARQAQRQVNEFVHLDVSTQLHAQTPVLVVSPEGDSFWRVPIHLTLPAFGDVGEVGCIQVNPQTGQIDTPPSLLRQLNDKADALALRFTSPTAHTV
jgi:hypothetical protein